MRNDIRKTSHPPDTKVKPRSHARARVVFSSVTLLFLFIMLGGARLSNIPLQFGQIAEVVVVALFVAAMIALALGMVGQARDRR